MIGLGEANGGASQYTDKCRILRTTPLCPFKKKKKSKCLLLFETIPVVATFRKSCLCGNSMVDPTKPACYPGEGSSKEEERPQILKRGGQGEGNLEAGYSTGRHFILIRVPGF